MESWLELYEQMGDYLAPSMAKDHPNLPVIKEEGCYYFGADGKTYLDFTAGIAVANTGHRHPKIVQSIKDAADQLVHGPSGVIMYESILKLSKNLAEITPGNLDCFFYGNSGTEAIEGAIKLAKFTTGRPYIISFTGCFHGRSLGALSVTTSKSKYRKFLNPSNVYSIPYANVNETPTGFASVQYTVDLLEKNVKTLFKHQVTPEEVAAFIVEPVLGEGGYIIPPKEWLQKLRELCNQYGILLIFDEVQTGFGRTGEWFAAQTFGVTPDIMAIAKGIASGLPLSATVASRELMEKWPMGSHGTTFGGNPISCSVALTTLEVMKEENLLENTKQVGAYAVDFLKGIQEKYDVVGEVRAIGLMIGINIIDPKTGLGDGIALKEILDNALEEGVLFYLCGNDNDVIRMIPPLTVTKEQIDEGLTMLDHAIQKYMDKRSE